eukprot:1618184-Lingulodinium_polyedra.AAC.1
MTGLAHIRDNDVLDRTLNEFPEVLRGARGEPFGPGEANIDRHLRVPALREVGPPGALGVGPQSRT